MLPPEWKRWRLQSRLLGHPRVDVSSEMLVTTPAEAFAWIEDRWRALDHPAYQGAPTFRCPGWRLFRRMDYAALTGVSLPLYGAYRALELGEPKWRTEDCELRYVLWQLRRAMKEYG
jgi:hypothetical protein